MVERLLKFVTIKEKDHLVTPYEDYTEELTEKINVKAKERDELAPPKEGKKETAKPKRQKRVRKNSADSEKVSESASLEDRLRNILREVSRRSDMVRLSKDDFESFSEAQT